MSGLWVFICGPSGAGKDSVIHWVHERLGRRSEFVFARRMVTRPSYPGSDHDPVSPQQFSRLLGSGGLAWCWEAHGFSYGVAARYAADVAAGKTVVINGSREHVGALGGTPQVRVVQILANANAVQARLELRGRDAPLDVARRLARNALFPDLRADCNIVNEGELSDAGRQLEDYLLNCAATAAAPTA